MTFRLTSYKTILVKVSGSIKDEKGESQQFSFSLVCKRLTQSEIDEALANKSESVKDFLRKVVQDWDGVLDEEGVSMVFGPETFEKVLDEPGLRTVCFNEYMSQIGAVPKN